MDASPETRSGSTRSRKKRTGEKPPADPQALTLEIQREAETLAEVEDEIRRVIVGQKYLVDRLLVGLLTRGHMLIEGVPGLAKTLAVKTLAKTLEIDFQRIQFTPDLLPADLVGTLIYDQKSGEFTPRKGPIFHHIILTDEINRAPAKVQSALLESMEEKQVTLGDTTYPLPEPFMVLATQNPIEQEGTYPLAEAQVDRFMMKLKLTYPSRQEEQEILERMLVESERIEVRALVDRDRLLRLCRAADRVILDDKLKGYILDIVTATRDPSAYRIDDLQDLIAFGASPRATLFLARAVKGLAMVHGRAYVIPEDVKELAADVLRHRIVTTFEAEAEEVTTDDLVERILERIEVP